MNKCIDDCANCIKDNGKDSGYSIIAKMVEHLRPKRWTVDVFLQLKKTFSVNLQIILYTFAYKNKGVKKWVELRK